MRVLNSIFVFLCGTCSIFARPYEYSYYISSPGQYQTLQVKDGEASVNEAHSFTPGASLGPLNPSFRTGRFGPAFNQNPQFGQQFPINSNGPDFRRGLGDIPESELDPLFNQRGRFPQDPEGFYQNPQRGFDNRFNHINPYAPSQNRPDFRQGNFYFDRRYNQIQPNVPEFGIRTQLFGSQGFTGPQRARLSQEIDKSKQGDREEVTTPQPCRFCGVDKANPMDGIDVVNADPDSETIEPKSVGGNRNPNILVQNSVVTPASVVPSSIVPYYVLV